MEIEAIAKEIAQVVQKEGSVRAVFGEPIQLGSQSIVPIAKILVSLGGGGGGGSPTAGKANTAFSIVGGGGGGINLVTEPVGFLSERDGTVVFTPIPSGPHDEEHETPQLPNEAALFARVLARLKGD